MTHDNHDDDLFSRATADEGMSIRAYVDGGKGSLVSRMVVGHGLAVGIEAGGADEVMEALDNGAALETMPIFILALETVDGKRHEFSINKFHAAQLTIGLIEYVEFLSTFEE